MQKLNKKLIELIQHFYKPPCLNGNNLFIMKSYHNISLLIGFIAACLIGCDSFENDSEPQGEEVFDLDPTIVALPGTSVFIDLSDKVNTSDVVTFNLEKAPSKGSAAISESAVLNYSPNDDFLSGSDLLMVKLINENGTILDLDTIIISMEDSLINIPCFNGALSDYYLTTIDSAVVIEPILNDGYCVDETSGAIINITSQPQNGQLDPVELFVYEYTPDPGFEGIDSFMYELELIDNNGNSNLSLAQVTVEVISDIDTTTNNCFITYPGQLTLPTAFEQYHIIEPFVNESPACDVLSWGLDIIEVTNGQAIVNHEGFIQYYPANYGEGDSAIIEYDITIFETVRHSMKISFYDSLDTTPICDSVLTANDDFYSLNLVDSTNHTGSYKLFPTINDVFCDSAFVTILSGPDLGTASIDDSTNILYSSFEEFTGSKTTSILYELCDGITCDTATFNLEVIK